MKIRSGFVSNSSTSSFLVYGTVIDYTKLEKLLEAKYGEDCEIYEVLENEGLEQYSETDYGNVVGVSFTDIGEDETPRQFKQRVKAKIEEVLGAPVKECDIYGGEYAC